MNKVEERVKAIICEQLNVDEKEVTPSALLTDDLGADSLDSVELAMAFEEEFGLEPISETQIDKFTTVQDLLDYLQKEVTQ
jgi:acyl carrier protein